MDVRIRGNAVEIRWNKESPEDVTLARRKFEEYVRQGWLAFTTTSDGKKIQIFTFERSLERISLIPLAAGR